ncbi:MULTISPECIES: hypothetical protein [unclassified Streptomyces]|jgi:hypothetical protein|uniref:hypothetical protein n=1 Tax=unclassified Streptomyces TaxID=2593676 RepID=UPI0004AB15BF|nr:MULTISPECIES: hypothetical protein [unclassified Streptomyces]APU38666.1 hypothetical protein BSL84_01650 [Streptomyces sp. TN58]KJK52609.1 hypothetical protein UK14_08220 [Streptomyces sp. NRRL F-4428]
MSKQTQQPGRTTPPSQAPGESGDAEARREADEAALAETNEGEAGDALTPNSGAQRRAAEKTGDAGMPE